MRPIAAHQEIALDFAFLTAVLESNSQLMGFEIANRNIFNGIMDGTSARQTRRDQILHQLVLAVNRDRAPARQFLEVDAMPATVEGEIDPAMFEPFALQPIAEASLDQQIDRALFQHTRAHTFNHVLACARFDNFRVDPFQVQQMSQKQTRGASADDPDLCSRSHHSPRLITLWPAPGARPLASALRDNLSQREKPWRTTLAPIRPIGPPYYM